MNISSYYWMSQLSQASYADDLAFNDEGVLFTEALTDSETGARNMTETQALAISSEYRVLAQQENTSSGFSTTLFESLAGNEYVLAFRGSEIQWNDWLGANFDNAFGGVSKDQTVDLLNFYLKLITPVDLQVAQYQYDEILLPSLLPPPDQPYIHLGVVNGFDHYGVLNQTGEPVYGLGEIDESTQLTITGHSLGGHLASVFSLLFPAVSAETYTFNSVGFIGWTEQSFDEFAGLLSQSVSEIEITPNPLALDYGSVVDISSPTDAVSLLGQTHIGNGVEIYIESTDLLEVGLLEGTVENHSIDRLSDSLAVFDFLYGLDSSLTVDEINDFLRAASNTQSSTIENVVNSFAALFELPQIAEDGNHDDVYSKIAEIRTVSGVHQAEFNIDRLPDNIAELAAVDDESGRAYRYALVHLEPFAVTSSLSPLAADNPLYDLNLGSGERQYSDRYLSDRTTLLEIVLERNSRDIPNTESADVSRPNALYRDVTNAEYFVVGGLPPDEVPADVDRIFFGNEEANSSAEFFEGMEGDDTLYGQGGVDELYGRGGSDYIEGGEGRDYLFGGDGHDILLGGAGNDHLTGDSGFDRLYGGTGSDTYYFAAGDGNAVVYDDGVGDSIDLGGNLLPEGIRIIPGINEWLSPDSSVHYVLDEHGSLHIISDGLNIEIAMFEHQPGNFGITLSEVAPLAPIETTNVMLGDGEANALTGTSSNDLIQGLGDNDSLTGEGGSDILEGGSGRDSLGGGADDDELYGGTEGDYIDGGAGDDRIYAAGDSDVLAVHLQTIGSGLQGDLLAGGFGDDLLVGDIGNDAIYGGADRDILWGGAGDDLLAGDFHVTSVDPDWYLTPNGTWDIVLNGSLDTSELLPNAFAGANDLLHGGAGNDSIFGHVGNDVLHGDAGMDMLVGGVGDDTLFGGDGDDRMTGDRHYYDDELPQELEVQGNDTLYGGAGNDWMFGGGGNDHLLGGAGEDEIYGDGGYLLGEDHGNDVIEGGDNADQINGQGGDDLLYGGAGDDTLVGDQQESLLATEYHGNDRLFGGDGNDLMAGSAGDDELYGGSGDDYMNGDNAVDAVSALAHGRDVLFGEGGADTLFGAGGSDYLNGGIGDDYLDGDAADVDTDFQGNDSLDGGEGNDILFGRGGNDILVGGKGQDQLVGGQGNDTYVIALGDSAFSANETSLVDTIKDEGGDDTLRIGADVKGSGLSLASIGNDLFLQFGSDQAIVIENGLLGSIENFEFGDGKALTWGKLARLHFSDAMHVATTESGRILVGSQKGDSLLALSGDNTFEAGTGNDVIVADGGNNTYVFELGDGEDHIFDTQSVGNVVKFGPGISVEDILLTFEGDLLKMSVAEYGDAIFLHGVSREDVLGFYPIETFEFADGSSTDFKALVEGKLHLGGTSSDDILTGSSEGDDIDAGDGVDTVTSFGGEDIVVAGAGDDVIDGGAGNDLLDGGQGNDTYLVHPGSGSDVIVEIPGEINSLKFTSASTSSELRSWVDGPDLLIEIRATGDGVRIINGAVDASLWNILGSEDNVLGTADGVMSQPETPAGGHAYIEFLGQQWLQQAEAYIQRDLAEAGFSMQADGMHYSGLSYLGGRHSTTIETVTLDPIQYEQQQVDHYPYLASENGGETTTIQMSFDFVTQQTDNNWGGNSPSEGLQYLIDVYRNDAAWTNGVINLPGSSSGLTREELAGWILHQQSIELQQGTSASGSSADVPGSTTIVIGDTWSRLYEVLGQAIGGAKSQAIFSAQSGTVDAGDGDDVILATAGYDSGHDGPGQFLYGNNGDDVIIGSFEADWLLGGNGNNFLAGNEGNDIYIVDPSWSGSQIINEVESGYMHDVVIPISDNPEASPIELSNLWASNGRYSTDTLRFAPGVSLISMNLSLESMPSDTWFHTTFDQIEDSNIEVIDFNWGGSGSVRVLMPEEEMSLYPGEGAGVEYLEFSDGSRFALLNGVAGAARLNLGSNSDDLITTDDSGSVYSGLNGDDSITGGLGADILLGDSGADVLDGGSGHDKLGGGEGDDILRGGTGDDVLLGSTGDDLLDGGAGHNRYLLRLGDGMDALSLADETNPQGVGTHEIVFAPGVQLDDISVVQNGSNGEHLNIYYGGGDQINLLNALEFNAAVGEFVPALSTANDLRVIFSDGIAINLEDLIGLSIPDAGSFVIRGTDLDDNLQGSEASEILLGLEGNDVLAGGLGKDLLYGADGNDILLGNDGADTLVGGVGNDLLRGAAGDDLLIGSTGLDILDGGDGQNRYEFSLGDSWDLFEVTGEEHPFGLGSHEFAMPDGVELEDLTMEQVGSNGESLNIWYSPTDVISLLGAIIIDDSTGGYVSALPNSDAVRATFSNGNSVNLQGLIDVAGLAPAGQQIEGSDISETLIGGGGNDLISGYGGNDILSGLGGSDELRGGSGSDLLQGDNGNDSLTGGAGNDQLWGGAGDDLLTGSQGIDFLNGGAGNNQYVFALGDSWDWLTITDDANPSGVGSHEIHLPENVTFWDITLQQVGDRGQHINLQYGEGDLITLINAVGIDDISGSFVPAVSNVNDVTLHFGNGGVINLQQVLDISNPQFGEDIGIGTDAGDFIVGSTGDDLLLGLEQNDILSGREGNDQVYGGLGGDILLGGAGDDVLVGGAGGDLLAGHEGTDIYRFGRGSDLDIIAAPTVADSSADILEIKDIEHDDLWFSREGDHLLIDVIGSNDQVQLLDWYDLASPQLGEVRTDEYTLFSGQVNQLVSAMAVFDVPEGVGAVIPEDIRYVLEPTLVSAWQLSA